MSDRGPAGAAPQQRIGFEVELLAPVGTNREDLAVEIAGRIGGGIRQFFHLDSEPSLVPGMTYFLHLTRGFAVVDADDQLVCRLVDDITIRQDLDSHAPPRDGWYRIVSDEPRLMRLVARYADPGAPLSRVLEPLSQVFGVALQEIEGAYRVADLTDETIAVAAPLPGERDRPCEVITAPISADHAKHLDLLLEPARELGFTVPIEAAVHLHVDAEPLRQVSTFVNLVRLFSGWQDEIHAAFGTNERCRRLAPPPEAVVELVNGPLPESWDDLVEAAAETGLVKYADINLTRLIAHPAEQDTVEIRCLPGSIDTDKIISQAVLVERVLERCGDPRPVPEVWPGATLEDLLGV